MYPASAKRELRRRRSECLRLRALPRARCAYPYSRHTDLRTLRQRNAAGSARVQTKDLRSECFWKRIRKALRFCRVHPPALESIQESLREFLAWDRRGRFRVWRTIAPLGPNSEK